MARPMNPPYTLGKITYRAHPTNGQVQARAYYRDSTLTRRDLSASGKTEAAARRALQAKMNAAREEHKGGDGLLQHDTKIPKAATIWLEWKQQEGDAPRASTIDEYQGWIDRTINDGPLTNLTVAQANRVATIESWLLQVANERGTTAARQARKVLGGILALAERRDAIPASVMGRVKTPKAKAGSPGDRKCVNDECDYECGKRHLDTGRAFTPEEAARVLTAAENTKADIADLAHFLYGTGVRISEALHCTSWVDVDLDKQTVRVRGTKTKQADRTLGLSDDLSTRLRTRAELHGTNGLVFGVTRYASKMGEPRNVNNVSKALRRVFASAGVPWAGTHTFRRTVATWLDEAGHSLASIANQLGHADTNVTAGYLGRQDVATGAASVMVLPKKPTLRVVSGA